MRVLALGGAGAMGEVAVRHLATHRLVDSIVIGDRDVVAAKALADALASPAMDTESPTEFSIRRVDVADPVGLRSAMRNTDVVINTTGPYYRFGVGVLEAAIDAGVHYLDICDDPEPTRAMLALHDRARSADILAIIGMGASPGVSNLLARVAADRLDRVDHIVTGWPEDPRTDHDSDRAPSAAAVHWVHQFSHRIAALRNGQLVEVDPLAELDLDYPEVGRGRVVTIGHPEAVTLHQAYPGLRSSTNVMVITPALHEILAEVAEQISSGLTDAEGAALLVRRLVDADLDAAGPPAPFGWLFALATGCLEDRPTSVAAGLTAYPAGGMAGITGLPLALAAEMLVVGDLSERGVHPPETAVPPLDLLTRLAPLCEGAPTVDALVRITRSDL